VSWLGGSGGAEDAQPDAETAKPKSNNDPRIEFSLCLQFTGSLTEPKNEQ
jgi:hypothetical protein